MVVAQTRRVATGLEKDKQRMFLEVGVRGIAGGLDMEDKGERKLRYDFLMEQLPEWW